MRIGVVYSAMVRPWLSGRRLGWLPVFTGLTLGVAKPALAQDAATYFKQNCISCHTIGGGRLVGPDLKDATQRQTAEWLAHFIRNPQTVISSGDPYAKKLLTESGGVMMPSLPGMTDAMARALVALIEAESKLETSQFKGVQVSDRPFVPADVARGRDLFTGRVRLKNGGPTCLACHTLPDVGGLGGGALAPDLTKASERLGGRKGISAWLSAPATPTMQTLFASRPLDEEEILSLVAYLQDSAQNHPVPPPAQGRFGFATLGVAAAVAGLSLFDRIWRRRLRGVRSALVEPNQAEVSE